MAKGIDKAASLGVLLKHLGLARENLAACGGSYNDISMVAYADALESPWPTLSPR